MLGIGKRKDLNIKCDAIFVDLSKEEIPGDVSAQRVKVIKVRNPSDVERLPGVLLSECVLIGNLDGFSGDVDASVERMRTMARMSKFEHQSINPMTFIFIPEKVKLTNLAIREK